MVRPHHLLVVLVAAAYLSMTQAKTEERVRFHLAPHGAYKCDYGQSASQTQCQAAALNFVPNPKRSLQVGHGGGCLDGSWGQVPLGCSAQTGGDGAAHFKTSGDTGAGCIHNAYQLICLDPTILYLGGAPCDLPPFKTSNSAKEIKASLTQIVNFANQKTTEMEAQKRTLEHQMTNSEKTSVQLAQEKVHKTQQSGTLKANLDSLLVSIRGQQTNKKNLEGQLWNTNQQLTSTNQNINAATSSVNSLNARVAQLNSQINSINAQIAREAKKRNCIFGLGKRRRRRRRNAKPKPWGPRIRVRIRGRRIIRGVVRVVRETGRVIRQVVELPKCVVDQVLSRLKRTKEKAQGDKNAAYNQLNTAQAQRTKAVAEQNRLTIHKNQLTADVNNINRQLTALQNSLNANNARKSQVDTEINGLTSRINAIQSTLVTLHSQIKDLRERKSQTLQVISELKSEAYDKVQDLKELNEASTDELQDLLDDLKEINENIETSVIKLRKLVCYA